MHTEKRLVQKRNEKCLGISFSSPSLTAVYRGRVGDKTRADGIYSIIKYYATLRKGKRQKTENGEYW